MHDCAYRIVIATLTIVALASLLALRFVGLYSHQVLALILAIGLLWAFLGLGGIAWNGRLRTALRRAFRLNQDRHELLDTACRAGFWGITTSPHTTSTSPSILCGWKTDMSLMPPAK